MKGTMNMRRWNFKGFYGEYGYIIEHNNGAATLEMIAGMHKYRKKYSTLKGAKIALGKMSDSYNLKEVTHLIEKEQDNGQ